MTRDLSKAICIAAVAVFFAAGSAHGVLIGHWTFDEGTGTVAADSSGMGNDALRTGGGSYVPGVSNMAFDYPGGGATYFEANLGAALPLGAAERTITAWINPDQNSQDRKFIGYGTSGSGNAFNFTVEDNGIRFRHGGGNITYGGGLVTPDNWYHVVMRVNAGASLTGDVDVFINGVKANITGTASGGTGVTLDTPDSTFRIGNNFQNNSFDGSVGDVQFYTTALTDAQISQLFANPGKSLNDLMGNPTKILIDFGRTDNTTGSNYNNVGFLTSNANNVTTGLVALNDSLGLPTGISISITEDGGGNGGNAGSAADVAAAPVAIAGFEQSAWEDSLFGNGTNSGMTVTLSGLDPSLAYDLLMYGSRDNGQSTTQVWSLVEGTGAFDVTHPSGLNDVTAINWMGLTPNASGVLEFRITGAGSAIALNFAQISFTAPPVPEPATLTLATLGIGGLLLRRRRLTA